MNHNARRYAGGKDSRNNASRTSDDSRLRRVSMQDIRLVSSYQQSKSHERANISDGRDFSNQILYFDKFDTRPRSELVKVFMRFPRNAICKSDVMSKPSGSFTELKNNFRRTATVQPRNDHQNPKSLLRHVLIHETLPLNTSPFSSAHIPLYAGYQNMRISRKGSTLLRARGADSRGIRGAPPIRDVIIPLFSFHADQ